MYFYPVFCIIRRIQEKIVSAKSIYRVNTGKISKKYLTPNF